MRKYLTIDFEYEVQEYGSGKCSTRYLTEKESANWFGETKDIIPFGEDIDQCVKYFMGKMKKKLAKGNLETFSLRIWGNVLDSESYRKLESPLFVCFSISYGKLDKVRYSVNGGVTELSQWQNDKQVELTLPSASDVNSYIKRFVNQWFEKNL